MLDLERFALTGMTSKVTQGYRYSVITIDHAWLPMNVLCLSTTASDISFHFIEHIAIYDISPYISEK